MQKITKEGQKWWQYSCHPAHAGCFFLRKSLWLALLQPKKGSEESRESKLHSCLENVYELFYSLKDTTSI